MAAHSRNITFNLPVDLIRNAKIYAAQHDTTVSALVKEFLERTVTEGRTTRARAAIKRILEIAEEGPHFTGDPASIKRDDLYRQFDQVFRKPEP